jgi:pyruvate dehydrogenase E1 component beta subunit
MPSSATEAKGLLKTAIRDNNPVVFFEHRMEFNREYEVPEGEFTIPFGKANVLREGKDITIVTTSNQVFNAIKAANELEKENIQVDIIDLRTIVPLDKLTIIQSVKKTGRLLIIDEGYERCGVAAEIGMVLQKEIFYNLDCPIERITTANVPVPFSPVLEHEIMPNKNKIFQRALKMVKG